MKFQTKRVGSSSLFIAMLIFCSFTALSQSPILKHSYIFDDDKVTDKISGADGKAIGGIFENGMYVTSKNGDYIELPAEKIKINTFESITLEAYIIAGEGNPELTMLSYFGNTSGINGSDYLFQTVCGRGQSKTSISTKEYQEPWTAENSISCNQLGDNQLHHIVTTFDDSELRFYIDGLLIGSQPTEERPENVIANLGTQYAYLAKSGYINDWTWLGKIDEFNIYEGIMSEAEVLQKAEAYIPDLDLERVKSMTVYSNLVVDRSGEFDHPITGEVVYFTEIMPDETDGDRWVDQLLVFSEGPVFEWGDYCTMVRASISSGFLDVSDGNEVMYNKATKLVVDLGHVIQCWISLDVPNNSYSVYAKTLDMDGPVMIYENDKFIKEVSSLTHWSLIHNRANEGALAMNTLSEVDNVGIYPTDYTPSEDKAFFIANQVIPEGARVIVNPMTGMKRGTMEIKKIVLTDSTTELYFHTTYRPRYWVSIPSKTFIKSVDNDEKLYIKRAEGIKIDARHHTASYGYSEYKLVFPALKEGTTSFDYGEANEGGNWFMYDIQLAPKPKSEGIYGTWFSTNTGDWELSLFKDEAVYDAKVWEYDQALTNKKKGKIKLTSGNESVTLAYKLKKDQLLIGPSKKELTVLDHDSDYSSVPKPTNPAKFEAPVFKMDTAILSGYVKHFTQRAGNSTGTIFLDNVISGVQENHLLEIQPNGTFRIEIPVAHAQEAWIRWDFGLSSIFLEPGEVLFLMIDPSSVDNTLAMGKNSRLVHEIIKYEDDFIMKNFYYLMRDTIPNLDPEGYKEFCLSTQNKEFSKLEKLNSSGDISDRYYQLQKLNIQYKFLEQVLRYSLDKPRSNPSDPQPELPSDPAFYSFITSDLINNEMAMLTTDYNGFLNSYNVSLSRRLGYSATFNHFYDLAKMREYLPGIELYRDLFDEALEVRTPEFIELQSAYFDSIRTIQPKVIKYHEAFLKEYSDSHNQETRWFANFIEELSKVDTISEQTKKYCDLSRTYFNNPMSVRIDEFAERNKDLIQEVNTNYKDWINTLVKIHFYNEQKKVYKDQLGIKDGLANDLIFSQSVLNSIVEQLTPATDEQLKVITQNLQNSDIIEYVLSANQAIKSKNEATESVEGSNVNEAPETKADEIFEAIVSKYEGKVIYVDFWATWCGPCRSSMNRQKPMKKKLMDEQKDIVFLYITNPSSPETTYNNMIKTIQGEHYRLSQDEWNHISSKFNINGIPHYAIVNKSGKVVDANAPRQPSVLLPKFEELMAEELAAQE